MSSDVVVVVDGGALVVIAIGEERVSVGGFFLVLVLDGISFAGDAAGG